MLTVYGIETGPGNAFGNVGLMVATVLTVYGIETGPGNAFGNVGLMVATVLTVYGIETSYIESRCWITILMLQQCLPFMVLKHI